MKRCKIHGLLTKPEVIMDNTAQLDIGQAILLRLNEAQSR